MPGFNCAEIRNGKYSAAECLIHANAYVCKAPSGTLNQFSQLTPLSFPFVPHLSALEAECSTRSNVAAADKLPTCDALSGGVWHAGPGGQCYRFYNASEDQRVWQSAKCVAANSCAPLSTTRTITY